MAKILVVEDEDDLRDLIVEELTDVGHLVVQAENGKAGFDYLSQDTAELILSDITMPQMNGYQFFRSVREQLPQHAQIPFIFMTALADRDDQMKGLRLGVDDYITKPIDFDMMLLRVEANLRRRPASVDTPPKPAASEETKEADDSYSSDEDAADKLKAIVKGGKDPLLTSRFTTISLEKIRERVGDGWSEVGEQILRNAETVIRAHLGPKDSHCVSPSQDFLVCFADLDEDQLIAKTNQMRDDIWEKLFEITNDEELADIDAQSYEIPADAHGFDGEITFSDFDEVLTECSEKERQAGKTKLEQAYTYEEFYAFPLIGANGSPSKIKSLSFDKTVTDRIRKYSDIVQDDGPFYLELQKKMFERLKENDKIGKAFSQQGMLLPIDFSMMSNPGVREGITSLCQDLEQSLGIVLIIEVIRLPDRLNSHMEALAPLPVGRKLQFIEIRRPQQCDGVAFDQARIAYVSMSFDNAEASRSKGLLDFANRLKEAGVKLYIKDVPEGKLFEAQQFQGTLFSMLR